MGAKTRSTGFYTDDAARLAADAARVSATAPQPAAPPSPTARTAQRIEPQAPVPAPAISIDEPSRPALRPEPARNQNATPVAVPADRRAADAPRRPMRPGRLVARVLLAPLYIALALASVALLVIAGKDLLGL